MSTTNLRPADYKVHPKEQTYFAIKVFFSIILYYLLVMFIIKIVQTASILPMGGKLETVFLVYFTVFVVFYLLRFLILVGYLKGNAVKVTQKQFPDIYNIVAKQAIQLGMTEMPEVYIQQSGGILNAFATNFVGTNYVVIYSDVLAAAYEQDTKVFEFVIGHEMGHIKRKHILKRILLFPGSLVPFLGLAYSRACEYTCDRIGFALCPDGATTGMILLAAGRGLSKKVNIPAYLEQINSEDGFVKWFAEKLSTHPNLTKRVREFGRLAPVPVFEPVTVKAAEVKADDHSKYLPQ